LEARCERGKTGEREGDSRGPGLVCHLASKRRGMHVRERQRLWRHQRSNRRRLLGCFSSRPQRCRRILASFTVHRKCAARGTDEAGIERGEAREGRTSTGRTRGIKWTRETRQTRRAGSAGEGECWRMREASNIRTCSRASSMQATKHHASKCRKSRALWLQMSHVMCRHAGTSRVSS